jgi:hypothetical protein
VTNFCGLVGATGLFRMRPNQTLCSWTYLLNKQSEQCKSALCKCNPRQNFFQLRARPKDRCPFLDEISEWKISPRGTGDWMILRPFKTGAYNITNDLFQPLRVGKWKRRDFCSSRIFLTHINDRSSTRNPRVALLGGSNSWR